MKRSEQDRERLLHKMVEKLLTRVSLEPTEADGGEDWRGRCTTCKLRPRGTCPDNGQHTRPRFKRYAVYEPVGAGRDILGFVYQVREAVHRYAGRLICHTNYVRRWQYSVSGGRQSVGLYYDTRTRAVSELVEAYLRWKGEPR